MPYNQYKPQPGSSTFCPISGQFCRQNCIFAAEVEGNSDRWECALPGIIEGFLTEAKMVRGVLMQPMVEAEEARRANDMVLSGQGDIVVPVAKKGKA